MKSYKVNGYLVEIISAEVGRPFHFMYWDSQSARLALDVPTKISISTNLPEDEDTLELEGETKNYIAHFSLAVDVEKSAEGRKVTKTFPAGISKCYSEDFYMSDYDKELLASILESGLDMMEETFMSIEDRFLSELNEVW